MKTKEMIRELRRLEEVHKDDFVGTCETNWSFMCHDVANRLEELLAAQKPITGETSDGYHTFNELYHHRAVLFSVIVANYKDRAWKSVRHHDGTMYDGMFIVGIDTPDGQATYHYDIDPYWDMFDCRVREFAPEWDGHTPEQAIERIGKLKVQASRNRTVDDLISRKAAIEWFFRPYSNEEYYSNLDVERALKAIPAVDAAPVVHGHWRDTGSGQECSVCHEIQYGYDSGRFYCANCGAKMDDKWRNNK